MVFVLQGNTSSHMTAVMKGEMLPQTNEGSVRMPKVKPGYAVRGVPPTEQLIPVTVTRLCCRDQ